MKATQTTKNKAKAKGIKLSTKSGKKTEAQLKAQIKNKTKVKKLTKSEALSCGKNLGSRGGLATAKNKRKKK